MVDVAIPPMIATPVGSVTPWLIRMPLPKIKAEGEENKAPEIPAEAGVYVKMTTKDVFKAEKGGKLVKFCYDVLLLDGQKMQFQQFKYSMLKNMDSGKNPMSFAGNGTAQATRACNFVQAGAVSVDGTKVTLHGTEAETYELVGSGHLKISKQEQRNAWNEVYCRIGKQHSVEVQSCDKLTWVGKEGVAPDGVTVCALQDCASIVDQPIQTRGPP